mgnify:CR=1 FL=1
MEGRMSALSIRRDRTPTVLRKLAKGESDARIIRRILAIANALDGMSREEAAQGAGMTAKRCARSQRAGQRHARGPAALFA